MPKIIIDGNEIEVQEGLTILQACKIASKEIPHFCFHERLKIAGNCRMCLVEVEKSPKPVASCAMNVSEGMVIHTDSEKVKKAREGVMEFLLINHPLDCPICDQGGECDLQDQAFKYGRKVSRYKEEKRAVQDKDLGPLVATNMTRCIHCTRCIRFSTEIAGVEEMGAIYRGEHMEITSYLDKALSSELAGNVIDLCPVGALTSKPYAFKARSWELNKTESIDIMDAMGCNIRVDSRGLEVMRILPKINDEINEEWISDKARFSYDGLKSQRLDKAFLKKDGKFTHIPLPDALKLASDKIKQCQKDQFAAIAGTDVCVEALFMLKKIATSTNSNLIDANQFGYKVNSESRGNYLFNSMISGIDKADMCIIVGANIRHSAPVLGGRIGQRVRSGELIVARVGEEDDQTFPILELGDSVDELNAILSGKSKITAQFKAAKFPMIIVGDSVLIRKDGEAITALIHEIAMKYKLIRADWNGVNIIHNHASFVGALDIGFMYGKNGDGTANILKKTQEGSVKLLYLLSADEINPSDIANDVFVIYQGHHGDKLAPRADLIIPSAAYTEQDGIYVNFEGRPQYARRAVQPLKDAMADWQVLLDLSSKIGIKAASDLVELRKEITSKHEMFAHMDKVIPSAFSIVKSKEELDTKTQFCRVDIDYYRTDSISRNSVTMSRCALEKQKKKNESKRVA